MRLVLSGLFVALSVTVRVAVRVPVAVGLNVTLIVQLDAAATLVPQVFVCAKSPLLAPVRAMVVMLNAALPGLERVTGWDALVVPTFWLANVREVGERLACTPEPVTLAVRVGLVAVAVTGRVGVRVTVAEVSDVMV